MATGEYGRIVRLGENLKQAGIAPEIIARIMESGEAIRQSSKPEVKAGWMQEAMQRMDELLDLETRRFVREACACCLGGKRLAISKGIAKQGGSLAEQIAAANEAKYVFGDSVSLQEDGTITVRFSPEGLESYRCVCLPKAKGAVSITYCYCCGGHIKHHLQIALGRKLICTPRYTALSSAGAKPCTFDFRLAV